MTALPMRRRERCTLVLTYFSLEVVNIISIHSTFAEARSVASSKRAWNSVGGGATRGHSAQLALSQATLLFAKRLFAPLL